MCKQAQWVLSTDRQSSNNDHVHPLQYGNIFEYLSLWSEVQFLNIQNSKKIQEIQKPN